MENKTSLAKFACYWGSIFGSVIFLYQVLSVWIHFSGTFFQTLLYSLIVVFAMIFAYTKFRQTVGGGYLSFGRGLGLLSLMSLLMSAFFTLFAFVLVAKLDPSMLQEQINQVATLLESNDMDTSFLEDERFYTIIQISFVFSNFFFDFVGNFFYALLISLVFSRNNTPRFENLNRQDDTNSRPSEEQSLKDENPDNQNDQQPTK